VEIEIGKKAEGLNGLVTDVKRYDKGYNVTIRIPEEEVELGPLAQESANIGY